MNHIQSYIKKSIIKYMNSGTDAIVFYLREIWREKKYPSIANFGWLHLLLVAFGR